MLATPIVYLFTDSQNNRFYIKREDLLPYSFGGNKVRIALAYLRDMKAGGYTRMVAYGNARSNLCRVLSNLCAGEGIPLTLVSPADDDGSRTATFNDRMCRFFGAEIVPCTKQNVAETVTAVLEKSTAAGEKPYYIYGNCYGKGREEVPAGAYVPVYEQILQQEESLGVQFDTIALATGTGMTLGGLLAGRALSAEKRDVLGFSVARDTQNAVTHTAAYANACLTATGSPLQVSDEEIHICDRYRQQYGMYDDAVAADIREMLQNYGIPLDGTYTGKAWHALKQEARCWHNQTILFLHTGGAPLFFDAVSAGILNGDKS